MSRRTQIKLDRLARDFPTLHAQVVAGELSTHAAAKAAGIVKDPTPLAIIQRLWDAVPEPDLMRLLLERLTPRQRQCLQTGEWPYTDAEGG